MTKLTSLDEYLVTDWVSWPVYPYKAVCSNDYTGSRRYRLKPGGTPLVNTRLAFVHAKCLRPTLGQQSD